MDEKLIKILILNDNDTDSDLCQKIFLSFKNRFILSTASSLLEAHEILKISTIDILIASVAQSLEQTVDFLNASPFHLLFPVIVLTSGDIEIAESQKLNANILDIIPRSKEIYQMLPLIIEKTLREWNHLVESRRLKLDLQNEHDMFEDKIMERTSELVRLNSQLKESEKRFRLIAENTPDIIWTMDMSMKITYCNPSVKQLLGYTQDEMLSRTMEDIFTYSSLNRVIESFSNVIQNIDDLPKDILIANVMELEMKGQDDAIIPVEITATLIRDDNGNPEGIHGLARNISEKKKADEALMERNEHYQALFERSSSVMFLINPKTGDICDANNTACNFYGYPRTDLLKMKIFDLNTQTHEQLIVEIEKAMTKIKNNFLFSHKLSSGAVRDVEVFSGPIKVSGKELLYSIVNDITERKKAENNQKRLKEHYEYLIRISPSPTFTVDNDLRITNWNEKAQEVTGYHYKDVIGNKCTFFSLCASLEKCELLSNATPKPISNKECQMRIKNGKYLTIIKNADIIRDENGIVIGGIESFTDITNLKETKKRLNDSLLEKELLIKEIHNWVKNNMQIMSNLLSLHYDFVNDSNIKELITKTISRIESMAMIHEELYGSKNMTHIVFADYMDQLLSYLSFAYDKKRNIKYDIDVKDIVLGIDIAIPCALIINEIVSYSLKYSFPDDKKGKIIIKFKKNNANKYIIDITDNGAGYQGYSDVWAVESLGYQLLNSLVTQLKGEFKMAVNKGMQFSLSF